MSQILTPEKSPSVFCFYFGKKIYSFSFQVNTTQCCCKTINASESEAYKRNDGDTANVGSISFALPTMINHAPHYCNGRIGNIKRSRTPTLERAPWDRVEYHAAQKVHVLGLCMCTWLRGTAGRGTLDTSCFQPPIARYNSCGSSEDTAAPPQALGACETTYQPLPLRP